MNARHLVLLSVALACKTKRTDDLPDDQVTPKQLEAEMKLAETDDTVGLPLREPKVVVTATEITINGKPIGPRSDLDMGGKVATVKSVHDWTKALREHWKMIHAGKEFDPQADLTLPDDIAFADAVSLITTVAYSGYAHDLVLHCGSASAAVDLVVPGPPEIEEDDEAAPTRVVELWSRDGAWTERRTGYVGAQFLEGLIGETLGGKPFEVSCGPIASVTVDSVAHGALAAHCGTGCDGFSIGGTPTFHDTLAMVNATTLVAKGHRPRVSFPLAPRCVSDVAEARPMTVEGSFPPSAMTPYDGTSTNKGWPAQRELRKQKPAFRRCYDDGLARTPSMHGSVAIRFVLDRTGAVSSATDGGSDIQDPALIECMLGVVRGTKFPAPDGPVKVFYPLQLGGYPERIR